jgi:hypothetical protein
MRTSESVLTDAQIDYICGMLDGKELIQHDGYRTALAAHPDLTEDEYAERLKDRVREGNLSKLRASEIITALKKLPWKKRDHPQLSNPAFRMSWTPALKETGDGEHYPYLMKQGAKPVPRGSYAIPTGALGEGTFTNETNFYSVWIADEADEGGWRWTVRQYLSDERVKIPRAMQYRVLDVITRDPAHFASLYGLKIGKCGICSRKLTNDISRERGIGPVCAERWGW